MKKLTAEEFKALVEKDPSWASKLTEPVEITTYCDMLDSNITHLSPLLHYAGETEAGVVASFHNCKNLRVATGTFHGGVFFSGGGIEVIRNLNVTLPSVNGLAASFRRCKKLKTASGTFHGRVNFVGSGIERFEDLVVTKPDEHGVKLDLTDTKAEIPTIFKPSEVVAEREKVERLEAALARKVLSETRRGRTL